MLVERKNVCRLKVKRVFREAFAFETSAEYATIEVSFARIDFERVPNKCLSSTNTTSISDNKFILLLWAGDVHRFILVSDFKQASGVVPC